jgi:hypothetical protein
LVKPVSPPAPYRGVPYYYRPMVLELPKTGNRHEGSLLGLPNLRKLKGRFTSRSCFFHSILETPLRWLIRSPSPRIEGDDAGNAPALQAWTYSNCLVPRTAVCSQGLPEVAHNHSVYETSTTSSSSTLPTTYTAEDFALQWRAKKRIVRSWGKRFRPHQCRTQRRHLFLRQ